MALSVPSDGSSPFPDPVTNPIGFWVLFGIFFVFIVGFLVAGVRMLRRHGPKVWNRDPGQGTFDTHLDNVRDEQRRLEEQLREIQSRKEQTKP